MTVPSSPTIASIVTEALKRAGRTTPSATQISDATAHQFQEVKADISLKAALIPELLTQEISVTATGQSRYAWPSAAEDIASLQLIVASNEGAWKGTVQAVAGTSITLSSAFEAVSDEVPGRFIYILFGTGAGSFGQILSYDSGTKVAVVDSWSGIVPASGSTYLLECYRKKLWSRDKPVWYATETMPFTMGEPHYAIMYGRSVHLSGTPDSRYVLAWDYWSSLDKLDEAGSVFLRHLRSYRSLWIQGIAVKCMQRYDEDRYMSELGVYQDMLTAYAGLSSTVGQTLFRDV